MVLRHGLEDDALVAAQEWRRLLEQAPVHLDQLQHEGPVREEVVRALVEAAARVDEVERLEVLFGREEGDLTVGAESRGSLF